MATAKKKITMVKSEVITAAITKSPNKRKAKEAFDMYAGDASQIKGEKIVLTLDVADKGQDVNYFVIEYYPDYVLGYVTSAGPYHNGLYKGKCVLSGRPKKGDYLLFSEAPGKEVTRLKYKITQIQEWPLQLYHMHIPADSGHYDYFDSAIVAAYSEKDAKTLAPSGSYSSPYESDKEFLNDKRLKIDLLSASVTATTKRGVITSSFNAG